MNIYVKAKRSKYDISRELQSIVHALIKKMICILSNDMKLVLRSLIVRRRVNNTCNINSLKATRCTVGTGKIGTC